LLVWVFGRGFAGLGVLGEALLAWEFRGGLAGLDVWKRHCWSGCLEEALLAGRCRDLAG